MRIIAGFAPIVSWKRRGRFDGEFSSGDLFSFSWPATSLPAVDEKKVGSLVCVCSAGSIWDYAEYSGRTIYNTCASLRNEKTEQ